MRDRFRTKRSRILVGIASVFLLLVIIGSLTGDSESERSQDTASVSSTPTATRTPRPTPTPTATVIPTPTATPEPVAVLTVGEFFAEREDNPVRFDLKYENHKVLLSGVVCEIRGETLLLGDVGDLASTNDGCIFLSDKARLRDLPVEQLAVPSIGDPFSALCVFGEYSGTIFMEDCVVPDDAVLAAYATATPAPTPVPAETPVPPTQPPAATAQPFATPTLEEVLTEFIFCERLRVNLGMPWGQSPYVVYSGDPRVTGNLEPGDYIQILTPYPEDGLIRVKVYPHDFRVVGRTDDQVWIDWGQFEQVRLEHVAFTCED